MVDMARTLYSGPPVVQPNFNPSYHYLRTVIGGRTVFMVLGYVDPSPEGPIEVWYSASGEVVKLLDGRLVGTAGLKADWRSVRFSGLPAWPADAGGTQSVPASQTYVRERDLMPGYRFGVRDEVVRTAVAPPQKTALAGVAPSALRWYEERSTSRPAADSLPPARFGIAQVGGKPQVVYSEQCLSNDLCMSFERWTPSSPAPVASASAGT